MAAAAAVQTRSAVATNSPHLNSAGTKSMTASPRSNRNSTDSLRKDAASTNGDSKPDTSVPTIKPPPDTKESTAPANAPLAPPPKPNQQNGSGDDYFGTHTKEPNPFESAFGNPSETPGKSALPGVASLTSPAPLLPGSTPGWPGSLRSGPLSPAMLTGPTGNNDYFNSDHHFAGSFPTPTESSLRTGLTPGGGGSMFPQPSPNSQALYNQLQSGGATPGTLDFHRTAMTARAQQHQGNGFNIPGQGVPTSQAQQNPNIQPDLDSKPYPPTSAAQDNHDPFGSHQTNDAANGLFMLAQAGGQQRNTQGYPMPQQQQQQSYHQSAQQGKQGGKNSVGSTMSGSTDGAEQFSDDPDSKPARGGRGKKGSAGKGAANGKRKTDETPAKGPANKRQRANTMSEEPEDQDMDQDDPDMGNGDKKMTDEEKRKNFLERNRVAALKCRQRKKQWLANLQQKVEIFSTENDALAATVTQLREELVGLKTLLLAHKDCPVSQAQGISGMAMQQIAGDTHQFANPYGMAMGQGGMQQGQMPQGQMSRS